MDASNLSEYFQENTALFLKLVKTFDYKLLDNPIIKKFIAKVASKTDSAYNQLYGGEPVDYSPHDWNDSFTDDFWTTLLLFNVHNGAPTEVAHLAWMFGRLAFLTIDGPKPFQESKATMTIKYGTEDWAQCTIRDRRSQLVEFSKLGDEQKKDDIPCKALMETLSEFSDDYPEIIRLLRDGFHIPTSISDSFIM
jgi:hypothetical protein